MPDTEEFVGYQIEGIEEICYVGHLVGSLSDKAVIYIMNRKKTAKYCPHVHVCVLDPANKIKGKTFEHKKPYKILFSIKLKLGDTIYTLKNIEFEKIWIPHRTLLKSTIEWLNDWHIKGSWRNCDDAMHDYVIANSYGKQKPDLYKKWLRKLRTGKAYKKSRHAD